MNDHTFLRLVPDYVLDLLEPGELKDFEAHLATCDECRSEVEQFRETMGVLADAVPVLAPPPGLKDKLLARVREEAAAKAKDSGTAEGTAGANGPAGVGPESSSPKDVTKPTVAGPQATSAQAAPRDAKASAGEQPKPEDSKVRPIQSAPSHNRFAILPWLVAGTGIAASIAFSIGLTNTRSELFDAETRFQSASQRVAALVTDSARADSILQALVQPGLRTAFLSQSGADPELHLFSGANDSRIVLTAFNLPPAGPGRTYQLWGINTGSDPVSLGTFSTLADGTALSLISVQQGATFEVSAVTDEPAGGSPQPTTQPFLVGTWSADAP